MTVKELSTLLVREGFSVVGVNAWKMKTFALCSLMGV